MLRPYQEAAVKAAIDWIKTKTEPAVLELATGAGKSHVISSIAHWVQDNTGKKVLCLQPSRELTEQNHQKYELMGERAGLFSASVGRKETRFPVTYGTPGTVVNSMSRFGSEFACVIVDECFHKDTQILTDYGYLKISNHELINRKIACYDELTGRIVFDRPLKVWSNGIKNVSTVNHEKGSFTCTDTHKIFSEGCWTQAKNLKAGQKILLEDLHSNVITKLLRASAAVVKRLCRAT